MTDLPDSNNPQSPPQPQGTPASPSGSKEVVGGIDRSEGLRDATGQETELPREVVQAGVRIQPTSVPIPPSVAQMGVKPAGGTIPSQTTSTAALPISDDQIAAGLHMSIVNSLRWLAEWCVKKLKQIRIHV